VNIGFVVFVSQFFMIKFWAKEVRMSDKSIQEIKLDDKHD